VRILFIVASYQTTKDGVADYTALLAKECAALGHTLAVLAWNDVFVKTESEFSENVPTSFRLSSSLSKTQKTVLAKDFIQDFKPDIVSIQMVCFGFHPRGFVFGLGKVLKKMIPIEAKIEVMFHELWLGLATNHPVKEKLYGYIQKMALVQLLKRLKPDVIHVANNVYYAKLKQLGYSVQYLPLPGNIPIQTNLDCEWIYKELALEKSKRSETVILLFFGSIHGDWDTKAFFKQMKDQFESKKIIVVSAGSQGYGKALWEQLSTINYQLSESNEQRTTNIFQFVKLGFRSDKEISELLQFADFGISTTPLSLLGKSGTAMAMIEHGLPVIVTRDELKFDFEITQVQEEYPNVQMWNSANVLQIQRNKELIKDRSQKIAQVFLKDLAL
jgi:glycosyltransferase involved in cell wall biosynthesis